MAKRSPQYSIAHICRSLLTVTQGAPLPVRLLHVALMSMLVAVLGFVVIVIFAYAMVYSTFDGTAELPADCAIVFGAAVYGQNLPGPAIKRRVEAAVELYKKGVIKRLILSGGKGSGVRTSEADVMRALATENGVKGTDITIEDQSHSTWENIANTRNLTLDCESVVAISDQYHLARIELLAWRQGWSALDTVSAADRPPEQSEQRSITREVLAYLYYLLYFDVVLPDLPARTS